MALGPPHNPATPTSPTFPRPSLPALYARSFFNIRAYPRILFALLVLVSFNLALFYKPHVVTKPVVRITEKVGSVRQKVSHKVSKLVGIQNPCNICAEEDDFCRSLGEHNIQRAMAYTGSLHRLRRVLDRAENGESIHVVVVGGSVSVGQWLERGPPGGLEPGIECTYSKYNMHKIMFDHIQKLYPKAKHKFTNAARGGTNTDYMARCYSDHIPEDADLILMEYGVNDDMDVNAMKSFEMLMRGLFERPKNPAMVYIDIPSLALNSIGRGGMVHQSIASFYDVPILSMRNVVMPQILLDPGNDTIGYFFNHMPEFEDHGQKWREWEVLHLSHKGHDVTGRLGKIFFERLKCMLDRPQQTWRPPYNEDWRFLGPEAAETLPPYVQTAKWGVTPPQSKSVAMCYTMDSLLHPLKPYNQSGGWQRWAWKRKNYLLAYNVGDWIEFKVKTGVNGEIHIIWERSHTLGFGMVDCILDGDSSNVKRLDGYWDYQENIPYGEKMFEGLKEGDHILKCTIVPDTITPDKHEFRFEAISVL